LDHPASAVSRPTEAIPAVNREFQREFERICPVRPRLRQPADRQVPRLRRPVVGRQFVRERFAGVVVDGIAEVVLGNRPHQRLVDGVAQVSVPGEHIAEVERQSKYL
jgi:hypothetical protein